jgi:hypothetical protein
MILRWLTGALRGWRQFDAGSNLVAFTVMGVVVMAVGGKAAF